MGNQLIFIDPAEVGHGKTSPKMWRDPGMHILICGSSGSGKTSTLHKCTYNLWKEGETIIWRDDANLEFFSFANIVPIRLYLPEGCDLKYNVERFPPEKIEKVHYNYRKIQNLFPTLKRDKLNVILFDLFSMNYELTVHFWTKFFYELYRYKRMRVGQPWSLVIDELNDLAPGARRGVVQESLKLSNMIFSAMKKFRKMKIRLVGTTHNYNDIHAPLRGQFNYYIIKRLRRDHVPERFFNYATQIESMGPDQCIIVDRKGNFQWIRKWTEYSRWHRDPSKWIRLKPVQPYVKWEGEIDTTEEERPGKRGAREWRERTILMLKVLKDAGYDLDRNTVANLFSVSQNYAGAMLTEANKIPTAYWEAKVRGAPEEIARAEADSEIREAERTAGVVTQPPATP
jgi:energy-coupling factor transporter ATP-binding protein EcfA2